MKQILQNLKTGEVQFFDTPCPRTKPGHLLIRTSTSLVSAGTERMLIEFGKANLINKARRQPDKVRMVIDKIKTDGLTPTLESVRNKLDRPLPMGYCNVGEILEMGSGIEGFSVGDRVASNGRHAEAVCVSKNLAAKIPNNVTDEEASFTVIGAIGLQGIRLARPTLGENFVVIGLGLVGLMTVQILKANGCRVLGIDFDEQKLELAKQFGAETVNLSKGEDPIATARIFSRSRGVDGVLITASTKSNEPVRQAARMCRKRGRIILIGVVGLDLSRADFYEKELSFQVSCSYGPGRHDPSYEEKGRDYPFGFIRWTEQRNFEAVLDMLSEGRLNVKPLISHRLPFDQARSAYDDLLGGDELILGILLLYAEGGEVLQKTLLEKTVHLSAETSDRGVCPDKPVIGFIGSGNYASKVLIPAFKKTGVRLKTIASAGGVSGTHAGNKYGFEQSATDADSLIADKEIDVIIIATRSDSHEYLTCKALKAGKRVFVEKPLAINPNQLGKINSAYRELKADGKSPFLMVGFNRRFAPHIVKMKSLLETLKEPKCFIVTVNAGYIPDDDWNHDPNVGGGRIIGEACHFIDLLRFLVGKEVDDFQGVQLGKNKGNASIIREDKMSISLQFIDGSIGTIHYLANGHKSFSKERLEVFCSGRILQLDNFRKLKGYGWPNFKNLNLWTQDKGQMACAAEFVSAIQNNKQAPIQFDELVEATQLSMDVKRFADNNGKN